jgi:hypothetical protein
MMEALDVLRAVARRAQSIWYGQWGGEYVMVLDAKDGAAAEVDAMKVGRVTRHRCGTKDVLVLEPDASPVSAHAIEVLRELRLLPRIEANGVIVTGPRHVLESAVARLSLRGIRARLHGRELRVQA